jgi:hypothetical protein
MKKTKLMATGRLVLLLLQIGAGCKGDEGTDAPYINSAGNSR